MLSYAYCHDVDYSLILDKVLCEGVSNSNQKVKIIRKIYSAPVESRRDPRYCSRHRKLYNKAISIVCGLLVDAQDLGLPKLHHTLQSAFLSVSSGLLTIGAICSVVFKKNGLYVFLILIATEKMDFLQLMVHPV